MNNEASYLNRFIASVLDTFIFIAPAVFLMKVFGLGFAGGALVYLLAKALDGYIFYPKYGGNFGHMILGMQVTNENGEVIIDGVEGAKREVLKGLFGSFVLLNLFLLIDSKKQNLYDKVLNTYVVKNK